MNRGILALVVAIVGAIALAATFILVQAQARQPVNADIVAVVFHQSQSVQDFDDAEYTQRDPAALDEFQALLDEYSVRPGATDTGSADDGCPGSLNSTAAVEYQGGSSADLFVTTCGGPKEYEDFANAVTQLLTEWRESLAG